MRRHHPNPTDIPAARSSPAPGSRMSRRRFLGAVGVAVVALVALALARPRELLRSLKRRYLEHFGPSDEEVVAALRRDFAHLRLADGTAEQFVRDYRVARDLYPLTVPLKREVRVRFLLSTDFVPRQGDPDALLSYTVFYDPYAGICYNPFMLVPRDDSGVVI
jgi:hypothetical protein